MEISFFMLFIVTAAMGTRVSEISSSDASKLQSGLPSECRKDVGIQAYSPRLVYANRKDIRNVWTNRKNEQNETIIADRLEDAIAVDFLYAEGFVFWADVSLKNIKRIRISTREVEDVISVGLEKPEGLAVDWVARKLYWTDCREFDWETSRIEVSNVDGSNRKVLFWKDLGLLRAIAVDPLLGYMFWTDWGKEPKIERAEMDGSNRRVIIRRNIHWPNGLTIDYSEQKIYWTDAKLFHIDKANYDGSDRKSIFRSPRQCVLGHPFALTLYGNKIYWTDWKTRGILSTNKNNGRQCPVIISNIFSPMDIRAYEREKQGKRAGENPCNSTSNGGCSHLCLLNTHSHSCACPTGVRLLPDGKTCKQGPLHFLLLARKVDIRRISLDTPDLTDVVVPVSGIQHAVAIDFDPVDGFVYWSDDKKLEIRRSKIDGTGVQVIVSADVKHPDGVAVDWVGRNLYWTDTGTDRIEVSRLNGSSRKILISKDLNEPRAITLHPSHGHMYWTDWGKDPKIERAGLDGSHRITLVNTSVAWPNGITIDFSYQKIYWVDAKIDKIEIMNLDGSNRRVLLDHKLPHVFGFTVLGDHLYWTDWQRQAIESCNKRTGLERRVIKLLPDLMGLKAVNAKDMYGSNPCGRNNGGCSHLCLYTPTGVRCECPKGMILKGRRKLGRRKKKCVDPAHFLLLARKKSLHRIYLDTPDPTDVPVPVSGIQHAVAIDFDPVNNFIFWSDVDTFEIKRSKMDGTGVQVVISTNVSHCHGLAIDVVARNLFWTDTGTDRIEVSRLNGSSRKVLISDHLDEPRAIALHYTRGYMFWTDWGKLPKIERAELDGSHRITLVNTSVAWPNGIAVDFRDQKLYWVDAKLDKIEEMNLDGSNRRIVLDDHLPHVFGFTMLGDRLFWTDRPRRAIESCNKRTGDDRQKVIDGLPDLLGLKAVNLKSFHGSNPCRRNNGGCSHLCLYTPSGVRCECPKGMKLKKRKKGKRRSKKCKTIMR